MAVTVRENKFFTLIESDITPIATIIDMEQIDTIRPHCFAGIQFFADAEGTTQAIPTVGTVLIEVQTRNIVPVFESIQNGTLDLTQPLSTVSWAANTVRVRATPTGVDVATHYRLVVTCNTT